MRIPALFLIILYKNTACFIHSDLNELLSVCYVLSVFTDLALKKRLIMIARKHFFCLPKLKIFFSRVFTKSRMSREDSTFRDEFSAQQNEHLPFLISKIEANDEPRVC